MGDRGLETVSAQIGGEDVPQLAQPLPVVGGLQLFLLHRQLPAQPLAEIGDGFAHPLALLTNLVLPVLEGIKAIQQGSKALRLAAFPVLPDGAEGKLLRRAVGLGAVIGGGVAQMLSKEQLQLIRGFGDIQGAHPGIRIPCGKQRRLPAHQGGQAAQAIH